MAVTAVTTWEGTPAAITLVVAGSKAAIEVHESLGARNPRLLRDSNGGLGVAHYAIDFDSHEAYGAFMGMPFGPTSGGLRPLRLSPRHTQTCK